MAATRRLLRALVRHVHPDVVPALHRRHNELALQQLLAVAGGSSAAPAVVSFFLRDGGQTQATTVHPRTAAASIRAILVRAGLTVPSDAQSGESGVDAATAAAAATQAGPKSPIRPRPRPRLSREQVMRYVLSQARFVAPSRDVALLMQTSGRIRIASSSDLEEINEVEVHQALKEAQRLVDGALRSDKALCEELYFDTKLEIHLDFAGAVLRLEGLAIVMPVAVDSLVSIDELVNFIRKAVMKSARAARKGS